MAASTRAVPENIRITKVGLWFILLTLLVALAATNTGNNTLYMVWAALLAMLIVSGVVSRQNVRRLAVEVEAPDEVYAKRPFGLRFRVHNRGRFWPRWFLLVRALAEGQPWLLPYVPRRGAGTGELDLSFPRRGRQRVPALHLTSLFPFGLFRKGTRYPLELPLIVYPELYPAGREVLEEAGEWGDEPTRRRGWGHDLHALRSFRPGDDPRGIHWKRTAQSGRLIFMEREDEESRRLSLLFDNGVGELGEAEVQRFERLVSEAATAAVESLARGLEVELVTRGGVVPFGSGRRQQALLLEALALVEPVARSREPLAPSDERVPRLRFGFEGAP